MITGQIPIRSDQWTEILGGSTQLSVSGVGSAGFYIRMTEQATAPDIDASSHYFGSWPQNFDFEGSGYPAEQRIWAKSKGPADVLTITRETGFYFLFIPSESDSLIDASGNTFKVVDNG